MNKQELIKHFEEMEYVSISQMGKKAFIDLIEQLDGPQKVTVPQFIANLIEEARIYKWDLDDLFEHISEYSGDSEVSIWFYTLGNIDILARAWLDGYEVEKEKRYEVKITASDQYLVKATDEDFLGFLQSRLRSKFTKKELENLGFFWVFDCPGIEIEEVEE